MPTTLAPDRCASRLKILADEVRLGIIAQLSDQSRTVGQLTDALAISQPLASHHLKVLRDTGWVERERQGKEMLYRLGPNVHRTSHGSTIDLGCCQLSFGRV